MSVFYQPAVLGALTLPNRILMAPLGRARAHEETRQPLPRVVTYYQQRASAGLIISEATHVSAESVSRPGGSAIHHNAQVQAWLPITEAVHAAGGRTLNTPDEASFDVGGDQGYIDYPFLQAVAH
ncbi:hypothetical protein DYL59_18715 [Pseudomonas kairouanensis]|uniref:NADH:flavin oxidoreductase/NADH oxidase N-terminal domain-containing protein n=1 Tax=Pseudomonas kairouanensis TaxID=2293832 RepID=A0A4Z0AMH9_9PSED|nr:hypothetical protein [Pseudomonas kairouanensis]TFY87389.1 hypothetical protein DYL59_18715 [Pseudomonas kairouanensis]